MVHIGLTGLDAFAPDTWPGANEREENAALRFDGDFLSEDFCIVGGRDMFIRGVLEIPVHGLSDSLGLGCWSTLSDASFDTYLDGFNDGNYSDWGPWSGWLGNRLADYVGDDPLALSVQPRPDRLRPTFHVQDPAHPLAIAQRDGIAAERVLELFTFYGHCPNG